MYSKIFYFSCLLLLINTSCSKNDSQTSNDSSLSSRTSVINRRLTDQEINQVGIDHNTQLALIFNSMITQQPNLPNFSSLRNFVYTFPFQLSNSNEAPNPQVKSNIINNGIVIPTEWISIKNFISLTVSSCNTYLEFESVINNKMNELRNNSSLSFDYYNVFMVSLSVLKYSSNFWLPLSLGGSNSGTNYYTSLHSIYPSLYPNPNDLGPSSISWKKIAEADAVGVLVGGIEWCVASAWTGAGSVGGFVFGLCWGAATSSALGG